MERVFSPTEGRPLQWGSQPAPLHGASFISKLFFSALCPAACSLSLGAMCLAGYGLHSKLTDDGGDQTGAKEDQSKASKIPGRVRGKEGNDTVLSDFSLRFFPPGGSGTAKPQEARVWCQKRSRPRCAGSHGAGFPLTSSTTGCLCLGYDSRLGTEIRIT